MQVSNNLRSGLVWWNVQGSKANEWTENARIVIGPSGPSAGTKVTIGAPRTKERPTSGSRPVLFFDKLLERFDPMAGFYSDHMRKMGIEHLKEKLVEFATSDLGQKHFGNEVATKVIRMDHASIALVADFLTAPKIGTDRMRV